MQPLNGSTIVFRRLEELLHLRGASGAEGNRTGHK
eukprot:CAMPEP_0197688638 /NCGR_PEP_ID=MMETSP1338-20131121/105741_1 /TAXON_ID=43686 ORGANISM="Pelagodinium beii, Strain RCC1491" /NCGR_SAMPLE_ID=MMETSP1338 /ASSEMBLY_ACC=CAM_ASM_000754 /LENGTH=34 /DNA_ID= /DNA_START= /DNA_END= /DNA_ORIENTATION=